MVVSIWCRISAAPLGRTPNRAPASPTKPRCTDLKPHYFLTLETPMKHLRAFSLLIGLACAAILLTVFAAWPAQAAKPAAGQVPQGCGFAWIYVFSNDATTTENALTGTAGIASNDVWAVGFYTGTNGIAQTLTE